MRTNMAARTLDTHGVGETKAFTIKASGKAFKILIDGLYADKIGAVIRETWSNAYDSHVAAGIPDQPFDCHLPTVFDPEFRLRDYGVSLSHDAVMSLYTTVFESTKEDSDSMVGTFGLGSKSPFAYTDSFTVTTWRDGERRIYSAYLGTDHVPSIALIYCGPSDEPRGLALSFPVNTYDVGDFVRAANKVVRGFLVPPRISGSAITLPSMLPDPIYSGVDPVSGAGWALYGTEMPAEVRQGCVLYPIWANRVKGLTRGEINVMSAAIRVTVPIGALNVTASREDLAYDDTTTKTLKSVAAHVVSTLTAIVDDEIASVKTPYEKIRKFRQIQHKVERGAGLSGVVNPPLHRGNRLPESFRFEVPTGFTVIRCSHTSSCYAQPKTGLSTPQREAYYNLGNARIYVVDTGTVDANGELTRRPLNRRGAEARAFFHYKAQTAFNSGFLIILGDTTSYAFRRILVKLGRPPIIVANDIPPQESTKSTSVVRTTAKVKELVGGTWADVEIDQDTEGFYVSTLRGMFKTEYGDRPYTEYRGALNTVRILLPEGARIFAIPATLSRLSNYDGLEPLLPALKMFAEAKVDFDRLADNSLRRAVLASKFGSYTKHSPSYRATKIMEYLLGAEFSFVPQYDETLVRLFEHIKTLKDASKCDAATDALFRAAREAALFVNLPVVQKHPPAIYDTLHTLLDAHPILHVLEGWDARAQGPDIFRFIDWCALEKMTNPKLEGVSA